jgi:hypothetical protein
MFTMQEIKRWCCIYVQQDAAQVNAFLQKIRAASAGMRYTVAEPRKMEIANGNLHSYTEKLNEAIRMDPQIIMVCTISNRADMYSGK